MTAAKWGETPVYEQFFARELPEVRKAFNLLLDYVREGRVDERHEQDLEVALPAAQLLAATGAGEETVAAAIVDIGLRMRTAGDIPCFEKALDEKVMAIITDDTVYRITKTQDFIHAQTGIRQAFAAAAIVQLDNAREMLLEMLQPQALADGKAIAGALSRMQMMAHLAAGPVMPVIDRLESPDLERIFVENVERFMATVKSVPKPKMRDPGAYGAS
jgi:hypothetical protein